MPSSKKTGYFILEGLNSAATTYYFYYLPFFMKHAFGFGNEANLALVASSGLIYVFAAWWGGRFAQRFGYHPSLKLGFATMMLAMLAGPWCHSAAGQIVVMSVTVIGMCFTWPTLEALVSEGEAPAGLQRNIGVYNIVWAGTGALAYFSGGALLDKLGPSSIFYIPAAIQACQLALTFWVESKSRFRSLDFGQAPRSAPLAHRLSDFPPLNPRPIAKAKMFLRLAWLANPFAYIAVNTLIAVMPGLADRLHLSTMLAGFCCSLWCFVRLGAFVALWFWDGWHYRFRWLLVAFLALMGAFVSILLAPTLAVLLLAQTVFGIALGLIYYSSLFYSMDVSETKGVHGGIHEAAIGLGNFAGPALGAASLHFLPNHPNSGALAVTALLLAGLIGLLAIWRNGTRILKPASDPTV
jgi:predicted MFS family arabinose efflux permease